MNEKEELRCKKILDKITYEGYFDENNNFIKGNKTLPNSSTEYGKVILLDGTTLKANFSVKNINEKEELTYCKKILDNITYEGYFDKNNNFIKGNKTLPNGSTEYGNFNKNSQLTYGKITLLDGTILKGNFDENNFLIQGIKKFPCGSTEEGKFIKINNKYYLINGKKNYLNGYIEEGQYKFNKTCQKYYLTKGLNC